MMRRWPRRLQLAVKVVLSIVVLVGWPLLAVNIGRGAYDMVTLDGCAKGLLAADTDRQLALENAPTTGDVKVLAGYMNEAAVILEDRVSALVCPSSIKDEQEAFLGIHPAYRIMLASVARNGIPKDPWAEELFWAQYQDIAYRASAAYEALKKAISDEWLVQHPEAAQAAAAQ